MSYWSEAKFIASSMLRTWRIVPTHIPTLGKQARAAVTASGRVVTSLLAIVVCMVGPLFFWAAPLLVPLRRRLIADEERTRKEALERLKYRGLGRTISKP